ncbi:hypothetical protein EXIGLDRAFT_691388, partial [Exidia glandulosa HHB12029]
MRTAGRWLLGVSKPAPYRATDSDASDTGSKYRPAWISSLVRGTTALCLTSRRDFTCYDDLKLARSSPSPPPASRRLSQSGRVSRPLRSSLTISRSGDPTATVALDWSTSYQASASSSASAGFYEDESLDEAEDSDPDVVVVRGRAPEPAPKPAPAAQPTSFGVRGGAASKPLSRQSTITHNGTVGTSNVKSPFAFDSATLTRRGRPQRSAASRSRSPKPPPTPSSPPARPPSPVALLRPSTGPPKQPPAPKPPQVALLPTAFRLHLNMPFTRLAIEGVIDARTTGEALLLLGGFYIVASRLRDLTDEAWVQL